MKSRPRWSHVIFALGLIAALAVAVPAFGISKSLKKAISKEVAKQVARATGPAGPPGAQGPQGTALAYARLSPGGTLDPAATKNVVVPYKGTGTYCLNVTTAQAPSNVQATIDVGNSDARKASVAATLDKTAITNQGCPAGTDLLVITTFWQPAGAVAQLADSGFYVEVN